MSNLPFLRHVAGQQRSIDSSVCVQTPGLDSRGQTLPAEQDEEDLVDGYCTDEYEEDHDRDLGHRDQVFGAVGECLASRKRRRH